MFSEMIKHRTNRGFVKLKFLVETRFIEQITGKLLADHLVVGYVCVESTNQVIAITPGSFCWHVPFIAVGICVADDIHPVSREPLAEVSRVEMLVDEMLPRVFAFIVDEFSNIIRGWRQTC